METVIETLKAANSNKATGPDNIPVRVLKIAAEILSPSLTAIFNRSLSMGIYPDDWKMARGVGTGGAQGARAPPPKFLPRPKSALFRNEKCALFDEANVAVKTTIF